jgi:NTP pyrophosphatase (non-canonical NTP hydrolase)
MEFDEYQKAASNTAIYPSVKELVAQAAERSGHDELANVLREATIPDVEGNPYYPALGLGEMGEVQNKIKKIARDHKGVITNEMREEVSDEIGDCFWYLAALCQEFGLSMDDVAKQNVEKLLSRKVRGTLTGSGDDR